MRGCAAADAPTAPALRSCPGINNATDEVVWHSRRRWGDGRHQSRYGEAGIDAMVIVADLPTEKWSTDVAVRADGDLVFCPRGTEVKIFGVLKPYSEVFST